MAVEAVVAAAAAGEEAGVAAEVGVAAGGWRRRRWRRGIDRGERVDEPPAEVVVRNVVDSAALVPLLTVTFGFAVSRAACFVAAMFLTSPGRADQSSATTPTT